MLKCGLPSLNYIKDHFNDPTVLEMFFNYIEIPRPITDLLKIDGAMYKNDRTMTIFDGGFGYSAMVGWYGSVLNKYPTDTDGVFVPTWSDTSLDSFKTLVSGDLEELENGILKGKVWQRSQTIASQETIDRLKEGIENKELSPIIEYSLPTYHFNSPYANHNSCYLLDGVVYYVQGINKRYEYVRIDDGRVFKQGDIVAEPIVKSDIFFQKNFEGEWVGCSMDDCAGVSFLKKEGFFKGYMESYIQLQEGMNQLYQKGELRDPKNTVWEELQRQYYFTQRELQKLQNEVARKENELKKLFMQMQKEEPNGGPGVR